MKTFFTRGGCSVLGYRVSDDCGLCHGGLHRQLVSRKYSREGDLEIVCVGGNQLIKIIQEEYRV